MKNNYCRLNSISKLIWKSKLFRIMKATIFIIVLSIAQVFAVNSYSQTTRLSLNLKNVSARTVLQRIEEQSQFYFIYDATVVNVEKEVSIDTDKESITKILDQLFEGTNVIYKITDRQIALTTEPSLSANQQSTIKIIGKVTDSSGSLLPGSTVLVKGTTNGTITDVDGKYNLSNVPGDAILLFSFVGMRTQEVPVAGKTNINVTLSNETINLDEVVAVGYGTQKKKFVVGSVSQISSKELMSTPMPNVSNLLTGKLPGVTSIQRSGMPGDDQTFISIRGISTFTNSSPLILVDGVERMLNTVNPADIENVSVLKDASTSAIYGVRGGNGVILITTKKGGEGKAKISYDVSGTVSVNTAFPKFLNGPDYLYWYNKASEMDGLGSAFDADIQTKVIKGDASGIYGNTDWLDLLFKNYGFTQQHNISATGGTDKTKYYISAGILDQGGIIDNVNYKRYNIRSNIDATIAENFNLSLNLGGFYEDRNWPGISMSPQVYMNPIEQAINAIPIIKPKYQGEYTGWSENGAIIQSPLASVKNGGFQKMQRWQFEGSAKLEYDFSRISFLKGLKVGVFYSYDYGNTANRNFLDSYKVMTYNKATKAVSEERATGTTGGGSYDKSMSLGYSYILRPTIEYSRLFGKHNLNAILLVEENKSNGSTMTGHKSGYMFSDPIDITWGTSYPSGIDPVTGTMGHYASRGYAGRVNYGFDNRYLAEFTFRYDGTYIFAPKNRWGFFPSVALGWLISEEKFFKELNAGSISYLKIKASYGESGSNDVDPYLWASSYGLTSSPSYVFGENASKAVYTLNSIISDLTWSRVQNYNIGLDLNMWHGLLGIEFDYFYKVTSDILETQGGNMPLSLGGNYSSVANSGKVDNRGFELLLKHNNKINGDWNYSLVGSLAWAKNKVLSRQIGDGVPWNRNEIGRSIGIIYGYDAIGLYQTQAQLDNSPAAPSGTKNLGDLIYKDFNGDGRIDENDFAKIGRGTMPQLNFSLSMNTSYKNFYLTALWQGVALCDYQLSAAYNSGIYDNTAFTRPFYNNGNAPYYLVENTWTTENINAKYPRLSTVANGNNAWPSSRWIIDGSYLRLKNLQLGYNLPNSLLNRWNIGLSRLNVYVSGTNLLTFSSFKYVDPEMPSVNNGYYPQQKTYSIGLNVTF